MKRRHGKNRPDGHKAPQKTQSWLSRNIQPEATANTAASPLPSLNYHPNESYVGTYAGGKKAGHLNGERTCAKFAQPFGLAFDKHGNLYVSERAQHCIRRITRSGVVETYAGNPPIAADSPYKRSFGFSDGHRLSARFLRPHGICFSSTGILFIADQGNHCIRSIGCLKCVCDTLNRQYPSTAESRIIDAESPCKSCSNRNDLNDFVGVFAGIPQVTSKDLKDGFRSLATFSFPESIIINSKGELFITDVRGLGGLTKTVVRKISVDGYVSTLLDGTTVPLNATPLLSTDSPSVLFSKDSFIFSGNGMASQTPLAGKQGRTTVNSHLASMADVKRAAYTTSLNEHLPVALFVDVAHCAVSPLPYPTHFLGELHSESFLESIEDGGFLSDSDYGALSFRMENNIWLCDRRANCINLFNQSSGLIFPFAGAGKSGHQDDERTKSRFNYPNQLEFSPFGDLMIADYDNHSIRFIPSVLWTPLKAFDPTWKPFHISPFELTWLVNFDTSIGQQLLHQPDDNLLKVQHHYNSAQWNLHRATVQLSTPFLLKTYRHETCSACNQNPQLRALASSKMGLDIFRFVNCSQTACESFIQVVHGGPSHPKPLVFAEVLLLFQLYAVLDQSSAPLYHQLWQYFKIQVCFDLDEQLHTINALWKQHCLADVCPHPPRSDGCPVHSIFPYLAYCVVLEIAHISKTLLRSYTSNDEEFEARWSALDFPADIKCKANLISLDEFSTGRCYQPCPSYWSPRLRYNVFHTLYDLLTNNGPLSNCNYQEKPNFCIEAGETSIMVHDWIMASRWTFFRSCIQFGGHEASERKLALDDLVPLGALRLIILHIYTNDVPSNPPSDFLGDIKKYSTPINETQAKYHQLRHVSYSTNDLTWLIEHGQSYQLFDSTSWSSVPQFVSLIFFAAAGLIEHQTQRPNESKLAEVPVVDSLPPQADANIDSAKKSSKPWVPKVRAARSDAAKSEHPGAVPLVKIDSRPTTASEIYHSIWWDLKWGNLPSHHNTSVF